MKIVFDTKGNEKQKEVARLWLDNSVFDIVFGGSKGSGKSFLGCSLIFGDALMYAGTHYFIARKTLNDLVKFTMPSISEVMALWGLDNRYYKYNSQRNYYELYNGSRVYLIEAKYLPSDEKYMRFGSMQMTRGWIEEAGEFEESAKANLAASIGRWKNKDYNLPGKLLQTCNPSKNYLYREYYKKHKDGTLESWKRFVQALPEDNKMLPDGYLENLARNLNNNEKERLLYGNWEYDDDPAVLIDYNNIIAMFNNGCELGGVNYITADIARQGRDKTVIFVWDGLSAIKCITIDKNKITEAAEVIKKLQEKYNVAANNTIVDEDGVGGGVVDILNCKGFVNNSKPIEVMDGYEFVRPNFQNLKTQCYYKLAEYINAGKINVKVDGEIREKIIEELEQVKDKDIDSEGKKGILSKEKIKELIGRSPDYSDALMMRMYYELQPQPWPSLY